MNLWGPGLKTDDELIAEIREYVGARKKVANREIASISGENRRIEFASTPDSIAALDRDLREMLAEARRRGLPIGGLAPNAIDVEIGH